MENLFLFVSPAPSLAQDFGHAKGILNNWRGGANQRSHSFALGSGPSAMKQAHSHGLPSPGKAAVLYFVTLHPSASPSLMVTKARNWLQTAGCSAREGEGKVDLVLCSRAGGLKSWTEARRATLEALTSTSQTSEEFFEV